MDVFVFYQDCKSDQRLVRRLTTEESSLSFVFEEYKSKEAFKTETEGVKIGLFPGGELDLNEILKSEAEEVAVIKDGRVVQMRAKKKF